MKIKISPRLKDVVCFKKTAVCLSFFLTIAFYNTINAQSITITTTTDEVNGNTTSLANLAGTPGGAGVSLREAIIAANNEPVGANITITIPAGTYTLSIVGNAENGSATGDLDINASAIAGTKTITLNGAGAATTIINTAAGWDDRLFDLEHQSQLGDITVNLNGLTLSGGNVLAGTTSGGAILAGFANNVTNINNCIFSGNSAPNNGGAISQSSGATSHNLTITNTTFSNNTASTAAGGAISYNGVGNVSITGCTFSNNTAGTQGAAINITGSGTGPVSSNMLRNTFTGNTANGSAFGGAAVAVNNAQTININYNRIVNNNAPNVASGKMISTGGGVVGTMNNDNNWWGVNTSPTTTEIFGTAAANWLQLKATASPTSIATGGISTVTGSFLTNSANNAVTVANLSTVIGLPITFANPVLGTLSGAQTTIQASGTATVTFTAGGTSGIGSVNTVVDNVPNNESSPAKASITIMGPPTITVTGTPLNAFTACLGSPSADQNFVVSGTDLTANLVVTAPSSFEISLTSGSGYSTAINFIPSGGAVANTTIYVRTTAAATGSPSGNISVSSTGATTTNIPVSATISQPPTTANAGIDASTCGLSYTLNGNTPSVGTGTWTYSGPGTISFTNINQGNTGITASVTGVYTLTWTISNGVCTPSSGVVNITFVSIPTIANAGTDQQICIADATTAMTGNTATSGTGTWTQSSGPSTATILSPNAPNTTINALNVAGTYTFRWTISNLPCTDSYDEVNVVVNPNPAPFTIGGAGTVCQPGSTLNGPSGTNYLYQWASTLAGNVPFTNLGTSQNQLANQSGIYHLTVTNEFGCSTTSPEVYHNVADYVFTGSLDAADPKQTGRINRFGIVNTCAAPKAFPGLFTATGLRSYDSYTVTNNRNVPVCATVGLSSGCGFSLFNAAYSGGGYNPSDPSLNYLADPGSSSSNSIYMEVTIPANSTIDIIVHEVNPGTGCSTYTLTVGVPRDPAAITAVPAAVVCNGTSTLTASVANSYLWSPGGQTTQSIVTPPLFNATNYNVTLGYGNNGCTDVASTTVTVSSAPPTVTCSPNIVTNNTIGQCGKTITYTTTSGGTPAPTITYSLTGATTGSGNGDGSGSFFNVGVTNVTVIATNACGTASCSFTVTINDTQNPTLTCPAPVTVSCASAVPTPDINDVTGVSDNCAGTVTITWQGDAISNQTCANRYTITRTYRATDVAGNFAECTQIITVNDQTPPVLTCPAPVTVSCASAVPAPNIAAVTGVSDNCAGTVTITWQGDAISNQTCANRYTITRTYRATDVCGNFAECTQIITVNDQTAPVITCPTPITVTTPVGSCTAVVTFAVTATDNCAGPVTITSSPASGSIFPIGITTVTSTATDVCGNSSTCTFTITVKDAQLPVITQQPQNMAVCVGTSATFSVTAITSPSANGPLNYQWQSWNGSAWVNISGATISTYTISNAALSMNTNSFRVQVIGLCTTVTSGFATLYVNPLPIVSISTSRSPVLLPTHTLTLTAVVSPGGGTFQWFKNGIAINGATGSTLGVLTVSDAGTYKVRYTDQNGCITVSADLVVSALQSNLVFIYPNPNNGLFHVRFYNSANEQVTISVFSSNGALAYRKVMTGNLPYTDLEINLGGRVAAGIYTVEVRGNNGKLIGSKQLKIHVPE